jgi:molecular chaperone DnaJ
MWCEGVGAVQEIKQIRLRIPAGVDESTKIRVSGEGSPSFNGGPSGDVYFSFKIEPHPELVRDQNDLIFSKQISKYIAALGGEIEVPMPENTETVKLEPVHSSYTEKRLVGKGVPFLRGC